MRERVHRPAVLDDACRTAEGFDRFFREVKQIYPEAPDKLKFNETIKRVLNLFVDDLIKNTHRNVNEAKVQSVEDIRQCRDRLAAFSPAVEAERKRNKDFLYENLYFSPSLSDEKDDAEQIVTELFTFWTNHPRALPPNYQEKAKAEPLPRVICDYIAGMTDPFIFEQYEKHCGT